MKIRRQILSECARILGGRGLLVIGITSPESEWGRCLAAKKKTGHIFYKHARFYPLATVRHWLAEANMQVIENRSTLYQPPENVRKKEPPREELDEQAGFVVMAAVKSNA